MVLLWASPSQSCKQGLSVNVGKLKMADTAVQGDIMWTAERGAAEQTLAAPFFLQCTGVNTIPWY